VNSGKNKGSGANKRVGSDHYLGRLKGHINLAEIMSAGAEVCLLGNDGPGTDFDLTQRVKIGAISNAGSVM
jgi:hypothetical protein